MPDLPRFTAWPEQHRDLSPDKLLEAYANGWQGAKKDPAAAEELRELTRQTSGYGSLEDAAHGNGWADSGAGKLVIPFIYAIKLWPGCLPGDRQTVGSCVSHGQAKALLVTWACELNAGRPDPLTGQVEGAPVIPPEGIASGVVAPQPIYWARGYNGHGWSCGSAAKVVVNRVGIVPMMNYQTLGIDLSNVTKGNECQYGSKQPPESWQTEFAAHRVQSAAAIETFEGLRDSLFNGYGINGCGSEGYSSSRNEDGVSKRSGSWAHSMAEIGADDRAETKSKYGEPLVLIQNSWGVWNSGGRRIMGTDIDIPPGSFWVRWSEAKRRERYAFSNVNGWPPQRLPDWGTPANFG